MTETQRWTVKKHLMKSGHGLFVPVPSEVVEQWNLGKGDEVNLTVEDGAIRMVPKQPSKMATISEEMVETFSRVMKGIQAKITMDAEGNAIHLEFSGNNKEAIRQLLYNLWRNLPPLFSMLGVGSVEGTTKEDAQAQTGRKRNGRRKTE